MPPIGRRTVLKFVAGGVAGGAALAMLPMALAASLRGSDRAGAMARDAVLSIAFDHNLHTRLAANGKALTNYQPSESLLLADGAIEDFAFTGQQELPVQDARHGAGHRLVVTGRSARGIERRAGRNPRQQVLHHWLLDGQDEIRLRIICRGPGRITGRSIEFGQCLTLADTDR